jgi:hypothetical protein
MLEPRFYGLPYATPPDWLDAQGPVSNPLGFLLRPWAAPEDVCARAAGDMDLAEEGESPDGDEVFCYWLVSLSPTSEVFFQATGSRLDTRYVRFKLTAATETFVKDASTFSALVGAFHSAWGWTVPSTLPDPTSADDASLEAHGIHYRLWREDSATPRLNLTMIFPELGLSSTAFSR